MNYYKKIAEMLGVEPGEDSEGVWRIMNYGYWYFLPTGELCYELTFQARNIDYLRINNCNFFRTKEEANKKRSTKKHE